MENSLKKILIVEDDALMVKILEFVLSKDEFELTIASNKIEAIKKLDTISPDLIITDIILPQESGFEVISYAKEKFKKIPVIVLSTMGKEEGAVMEAFTLGADDFVAKPFSPDELKLRMKRLLDKNTML